MNTPPTKPQYSPSFPVRQSEEHEVSRRQFCKFACGTAIAVCAGGLAKDKLFARPRATHSVQVGRIGEIAVGGYKLLRYPNDDAPCIVLRIAATTFAAYSQSCTHLMCPVNYDHQTRRLCCPCHDGFFSAEDGRVLAGPPTRALPSYPIELRGEEIWIKST